MRRQRGVPARRPGLDEVVVVHVVRGAILHIVSLDDDVVRTLSADDIAARGRALVFEIVVADNDVMGHGTPADKNPGAVGETDVLQGEVILADGEPHSAHRRSGAVYHHWTPGGSAALKCQVCRDRAA